MEVDTAGLSTHTSLRLGTTRKPIPGDADRSSVITCDFVPYCLTFLGHEKGYSQRD